MNFRMVSIYVSAVLGCAVLFSLGCSQEQEAEKIPAEPKPTFDSQGSAGAPKAGGGGGLGNPTLNPNFKPPQRRHKDLKMPKIPD